MKLIVGLGNPGRKFQRTRHNVGFLMVDHLAGNRKWQESKKAKALYTRTTVGEEEVELIKPLAFMNDSGFSVAHAKKKHPEIEAKDILIIHDDLDIVLGKFKLQLGRSAAGHKGVQSVIDALGTQDFWRLRIGIGNPPPGVSGEDFVLEEFSREEFGLLRKVFAEPFPRILEWAALNRGGVGE